MTASAAGSGTRGIGTAQRVEEHSPRGANEVIRGRTDRRLAVYMGLDRPQQVRAIDRRLAELEREWDIERTLETLSSALTITGVAAAWIRRDRRFLLLPLVVQSFFLQHAVQGWCPPLPILRRMGARTVREIETERRGLLVLREMAERESAARPGSRPFIPRGEEMP